jgi:hypothetical protein
VKLKYACLFGLAGPVIHLNLIILPLLGLDEWMAAMHGFGIYTIAGIVSALTAIVFFLSFFFYLDRLEKE